MFFLAVAAAYFAVGGTDARPEIVDFAVLRGKMILAAGPLKRIHCPSGIEYDCRSWPEVYVRVGEICLDVRGGAGILSGMAAIVTEAEGNRLSLFVIDGRAGQPSLHGYSAGPWWCPAI